MTPDNIHGYGLENSSTTSVSCQLKQEILESLNNKKTMKWTETVIENILVFVIATSVRE